MSRYCRAYPEQFPIHARDTPVHPGRVAALRELLSGDPDSAWEPQLPDSLYFVTQNINYGEEIDEIKISARKESE